MASEDNGGRWSAEPRQRLTVMLGARDHLGHKSRVSELVRRARKQGLAGATAFHGRQGYGTSGRLHIEHLLSDESPVSVIIVDLPERIAIFLEKESRLFDGCLVVLDDLEILRPAEGQGGGH